MHLKIVKTLAIVSFVTMLNCSHQNNRILKVEALPIDGNVTGNTVSGPNTLNDPQRFVWGASVIKGDDDKFHMLYSTWESGEDRARWSTSLQPPRALALQRNQHRLSYHAAELCEKTAHFTLLVNYFCLHYIAQRESND